MITNQDLAAINLSPTKKDFYQIWNELLDVAKKLSERWDPTSTNESDPGIVLLKVLTAIADKLNYNVDKNILEAFMPSAAQEESMRKLTEMMGYNMKYYQSAITKVRVSYTGQIPEDVTKSITITINQFANITNIDNDINYVVVADEVGDIGATYQFVIKSDSNDISKVLTCIEGELVQCETNNNNIVSMSQLDDRNRYYLPENQIAENGIFIYNIDDYGELSNAKIWTKVDNLNTATIGDPVFKFGYDSKEARPYIQFPEDISQLIQNGLFIYYIRTSGINGNISARTLTNFANFDSDVSITIDPADDTLTVDESNFSIVNENAAINGTNIETITQAYESFKKTVGTFDTLVTCRDYMNKIYSLLDESGIPIVSNCIVSDIRDDINRAITLCSFNDYGICYDDRSLKNDSGTGDKINHFNLILYPFKTVTGLNNYTEYIESFTTDPTVENEITDRIKAYKTIAHIFDTGINNNGILCIKNYLKLNAWITTINKVNVGEQLDILTNIKSALYQSFNMRQLDFGEEIPFDSILKVIEQADARIKNVALDEPVIDTRFLVYEENAEAEYNSNETTESNIKKYNDQYNKLALRNVLAGRIELFDYDTSFITSFSEKDVKFYPGDNNPGGGGESTADLTVTTLEPSFTIDPSDLNRDQDNKLQPLKQNEVIKLRAYNFKTTITYPAYVRYRYEGITVKSDNSHKLGANEFLYIYYKDQNDAYVYQLYKENDIIEPSGFDLEDISVGEAAGKSSIKVISFKLPSGSWENINMDILGTNEQISIKEKSIVDFKDARTYLYWLMNNEDNQIMLKDGPSGSNYKFYILQDGEYLFYTDRSKTAMAYYGTGSELRFYNTTIDSNKLKINKAVSAEDIINNGIRAIPWQIFTFSSSSYLEVLEYQYKTLTAGDAFDAIDTSNIQVTKNWITCNSATIIYADGTEETLPELADGNWQIRSYLALDSAPNKIQELERAEDTVVIKYKDSSITTTLTGPIFFKTNYDCQAVVDVFDTESLLDTLAKTTDLTLPPFIVKIFEKDADVEKNLQSLLHNFGTNNVWTKVDANAFGDFVPQNELKLNTSIPENHFGLLMIYLSTNNQESEALSKNMYLTAEKKDGTTENIAIFNQLPAGTTTYGQAISMSWWPTYISSNNYVLKKGINVVYIPNNIKDITIHKQSPTSDISIIFSNLDLINRKETTVNNEYSKWGINAKLLDYRDTDPVQIQRSIDIQLLEDIHEILPNNDFYYNCPMDNGSVLSINPEAVDRNTGKKENLASPRIWYDYNNVNNKFVISEIDADYLDTGIQIAYTSKR